MGALQCKLTYEFWWLGSEISVWKRDVRVCRLPTRRLRGLIFMLLRWNGEFVKNFILSMKMEDLDRRLEGLEFASLKTEDEGLEVVCLKMKSLCGLF